MHGAVVCGVGRLGGATARRVERELARRDGTRCLAIDGAEIEAESIARSITTAARDLLAHARMVRARDAPGDDGPTELLVLVIAHLGDRAARDAIEPAIERVQDRLLGELGPIFEAHRTGAARNVVVLPLLSMPHPRGAPEGPAIAAAVRSLVDRVRARPAERRCVPRLLVVEDVAEHSILSERELEQNVRNLVMLLLCGGHAARSAVLHGRDPSRPLATFACAVAELPRAALARWAKNRVALEVLDAALDAPLEGASDAELDAIEEVELRGLDPGEDPVHVVRDLLARYAPPIDRDASPAWHERAEDVRARYGPDHGDPSLDDAQPPPDPPVGWALERMRAIEHAWRLLQRRRFDDLVARERAATFAARDALLARIAARVDRELWSSPAPAPDAFRRATRLVETLRRAVALRLEDAIAERDATKPAAAPTFEGFRAAHAAILDAARRTPDLGAMVLWVSLFVLGAIALGPTTLWALGDALGTTEADWYDVWLRDRGPITSGAVALLGAAIPLGWHVRGLHLARTDAHREMWAALDRTVHGESGTAGTSVLRYFASRLRLARLTARIEALLAVRAALDRDAEALQLADRAAQRARAALKAEQRELGAGARGGHEDAALLLGGRGEALIEPLTDASAARALDRALPEDARRARVLDALRTLVAKERWAARWREEVPFSSIDALRETVAPHAEALAAWDPFAEGPEAAATAARIAAFVRRQARSLRVALDLVGDVPDASGIAIVPPAAYERVRALLDVEGAAGRAAFPCVRGIEPDRAYHLVVVGDLDPASVASLRPERAP